MALSFDVVRSAMPEYASHLLTYHASVLVAERLFGARRSDSERRYTQRAELLHDVMHHRAHQPLM